jgi:hypothetical protein
VIGCGIDQMLPTIEGEALKYSPDPIIAGFISGDIERSLVSFRTSPNRSWSSAAPIVSP